MAGEGRLTSTVTGAEDADDDDAGDECDMTAAGELRSRYYYDLYMNCRISLSTFDARHTM